MVFVILAGPPGKSHLDCTDQMGSRLRLNRRIQAKRGFSATHAKDIGAQEGRRIICGGRDTFQARPHTRVSEYPSRT